MINPDDKALNQITSWAADKYGSAAPSLMSAAAATPTAMAAPAPAAAASPAPGMSAPAPAAPTTTSAPAPTGLLSAATTMSGSSASQWKPPLFPQAKADVSAWYRNDLGRDGDAAGLAFWQSQLDKDGADVEGLYKKFREAAGLNKEQVAPGESLWFANTYNGPMSSDSTTNVDDWGRNVLGRELTPQELATWKRKMALADQTVEAGDAIYQEFLKANEGEVKHKLDRAAASQISYIKPEPGKASTGGSGAVGSNGLTDRIIDKPTETVQGQLASILAADSPVLQQARAEGVRTGFDRGLGNSSIAASAGADALIRAATGIATTDSGRYNDAANYNVSADNQLFMYDRDQANQFKKLEMQLGSEAAAREMQWRIAQMQDSTSRYNIDKTSGNQAAQLAQQMTIAQMQDQTSRWQQEQQTANSRYNTDNSYKQQVDSQKQSMANNIIHNMDLSPDRKAAMLEQLGFGTMAKDGKPGTGLAGAVYVLDSVGQELTYAQRNESWRQNDGNTSAPGFTIDERERLAWPSTGPTETMGN